MEMEHPIQLAMMLNAIIPHIPKITPPTYIMNSFNPVCKNTRFTHRLFFLMVCRASLQTTRIVKNGPVMAIHAKYMAIVSLYSARGRGPSSP